MKKKNVFFILFVFSFAYFILYRNYKINFEKFQDVKLISDLKSELSTFLDSGNALLSQNNHVRPNEEFYLNPEHQICEKNQNKNIIFITFVLIEPQDFEKRNLIRLTYGNKNFDPDFRVIFTVGMSDNKTVNKMIIDEFSINKDIVQINNFFDSYSNLTYKTMKSFKWISLYCTNSKYILRINDQIFVNTFALVNYFKSLNVEKKIFGYGIYGIGPNRDIRSKFYVSESEYSKPFYSDFIEGMVSIWLFF
jgi:hypothetical protein